MNSRRRYGGSSAILGPGGQEQALPSGPSSTYSLDGGDGWHAPLCSRPLVGCFAPASWDKLMVQFAQMRYNSGSREAGDLRLPDTEEVAPMPNQYTPRIPLAERLWSKVDKNGPVPAHCPEIGPCWLWLGGRNGCGYGVLQSGSRKNTNKKTWRMTLAHRLAWEETHGRSVPAQLYVLHHCDNPLCVRPDHLFLGTQEDNIKDCIAKGRFNAQAHGCQGESHYRAKLTWNQVAEIRRVCRPGKANGYPKVEMARRLGVAVDTIGKIVKGITWKLG